MMKQAAAIFGLLLVLAVIGRDAMFHFDEDVASIKREHHSPQRHWNIGYGQRYVYYDSPFRYGDDLSVISSLIEPGYALLSDLATSYYAAATLSVYVLNVHRHHRPKRAEKLARVLQNREFCYLEDPFHRQAALDFLQRDARAAEKNNWPSLRYVLLNKDKENTMLRDDCLALRSRQHESSLLAISQLVYEGEYLNVYQLDTFSGSRPEL